MSSEVINPSTYQPEKLTPLDRFEQLLGLMKKYADGESGNLVLPRVELRIGREAILTKFFLFLPKPIPGYSSTYSPSIIMELGLREPEPETGKLIGEAEQTFIRKDYLDGSSQSYDRHHLQATEDLEKIERIFLAYKNTIRPSSLTE